MKYMLFAIALVISGHVNANESSRQEKITKIILQVMSAESQKRMNDSIGQLMADLKAAMEVANPAVNTDAAR